VVTNERQYHITRAEADRFAAALAQSDKENADLHPLLRDAIKASLENQLQDLRRKLTEYDALRRG